MGTFVGLSKFRAQRHTAFKCSGWRFPTADSSCESPETHQHAIWEVCWVPYLARRYDNNGTTNRAHRNFHTSMCGATLGFKRKGNTRRDVAVSKLCEVELKCHKESSGKTRGAGYLYSWFLGDMLMRCSVCYLRWAENNHQTRMTIFFQNVFSMYGRRQYLTASLTVGLYNEKWFGCFIAAPASGPEKGIERL